MLLVRVKTPSTTPVTTTIAASEATAPSEPAATESPTAASPAHTRNIGSLRRDLDVAALEDTFVQNERLGNETGLSELDVGVSVIALVKVIQDRTSVNRPLGLARELIQEDSHTVDRSTGLEVSLDLLWRS